MKRFFSSHSDEVIEKANSDRAAAEKVASEEIASARREFEDLNEQIMAFDPEIAKTTPRQAQRSYENFQDHEELLKERGRGLTDDDRSRIYTQKQKLEDTYKKVLEYTKLIERRDELTKKYRFDNIEESRKQFDVGQDDL